MCGVWFVGLINWELFVLSFLGMMNGVITEDAIEKLTGKKVCEIVDLK